jgi:hypothetical protein
MQQGIEGRSHEHGLPKLSKIQCTPSVSLGGYKEQVMQKFSMTLGLAIVMGLVGTVCAQNPVNIAYPINGGTYPITGPATGPLNSAYITASFSTTCSGGSHQVEWGFDSIGAVGSASFYDQLSVQFVQKLSGGTDVFWVVSDCGDERVKFNIGS